MYGYRKLDFTDVAYTSQYLSVDECQNQAKNAFAIENSNLCDLLSAYRELKNTGWRGSIVCIKHDGQPAAEYDKYWRYSSRPSPNRNGNCQETHRLCGSPQDKDAICFPIESECPITNIMVAPHSNPPLAAEGWQLAGPLFENHALFIRKEHPGETPIISITTDLLDKRKLFQNYYDRLAVRHQNLRFGHNFYPYYAHDPRAVLFDRANLEDNFLLHVQRNEPSCLHQKDSMLTAARNAILGASPKNTHTTCESYSMAVHSAFSESPAPTGLYYMRETEWTKHCGVDRKTLLDFYGIVCHIAFDLNTSAILLLITAFGCTFSRMQSSKPATALLDPIKEIAAIVWACCMFIHARSNVLKVKEKHSH